MDFQGHTIRILKYFTGIFVTLHQFMMTLLVWKNVFTRGCILIILPLLEPSLYMHCFSSSHCRCWMGETFYLYFVGGMPAACFISSLDIKLWPCFLSTVLSPFQCRWAKIANIPWKIQKYWYKESYSYRVMVWTWLVSEGSRNMLNFRSKHYKMGPCDWTGL